MMLIIALLSLWLLNGYSIDFNEDRIIKFINNKPYENGYKKFSLFHKLVHSFHWLESQKEYFENGITKYPILETHQLGKINQKSKVPYSIGENSVFSYERLKKQLKHIPQRFDWRDKNVVTDVSNQGKCGACWAYSIIETVESMAAIKMNNLKSLSIQQIIDCASDENHGCNGGDTCGALKWIVKNKAKIQLAKDYPLTGGTGQCKVKNPKNGVRVAPNFTCHNFTNNEAEVVRLLAKHGPLVAAVDATSWQDYLGGIIQFHCESNHNHAVQIVGYDLTGQVPYYIVRNTWGTSYGINGYLHIAIGKNLCGIAEEVSAIDVIV